MAICHRAGAGSESDIDESDIHRCTNTAWLFGGVAMPRWIALKTEDTEGFKAFMERGRKLARSKRLAAAAAIRRMAARRRADERAGRLGSDPYSAANASSNVPVPFLSPIP
jgi:hypothetical protein